MLTTDYLRQRALYNLQDLVTRFLTEEGVAEEAKAVPTANNMVHKVMCILYMYIVQFAVKLKGVLYSVVRNFHCCNISWKGMFLFSYGYSPVLFADVSPQKSENFPLVPGIV